jgi:hypothetical protein
MNRRNMLTAAMTTALAGCGGAGLSMVSGGSSAAQPPPPATPPPTSSAPPSGTAPPPAPSSTGSANIFYPGDYDATSAGDASRVQAAYDDAAAVGGTVVSDVPLVLNEPINCTRADSANHPAVKFLNLSPSLYPGSGFVINHDSIGFDCTGNSSISFDDTTITTANGQLAVPTIGILWADSQTAATPVGRLSNPKIVGNFSVAGFYDFGGEQLYIDGGYMYNSNPGGRCAVFTVNNVGEVESIVPGLIATGVRSMTIVDLVACNWLVMNGGAESDCILIDGVAGFHSQGGWAINPTGRSVIYVDNTHDNSGTTDCSWENMRLDTDTNKVRYGLLFGAATQGQIHTNWKVKGVHFATSKNAIAALDAHTTLSGLSLDDVSESASLGLNVPGTVNGLSRLRTGPMPVRIGTLSHSYIEGLEANWSCGFGPGVTKVTYG